MKYASLDLETTGLDPNTHQIIEFAVVIDDLSKPVPIDTLPAITGYVSHDYDLVWQLGALNMFRDRIPEYISAEKIKAGYVIDTILHFLPAYFIDGYAKKSQKPEFNALEELKKMRVTFAGKNFPSFDRRFLEYLPHSESLIDIMHHRSIDPAILFLNPQTDKLLPSTSECNVRAGLNATVSHRALDDARNVVRLIRSYYKLPVV